MRSFPVVYFDRGDININFPNVSPDNTERDKSELSNRAVINSIALSWLFTSLPSAVVIAKHRLVDDCA